ncbi:MAG: hypothetical protein K2I96_08630 [Lachnospiraceae bacterium]|nr:hypothetical protein [Lachnospiraceae bacterium]
MQKLILEIFDRVNVEIPDLLKVEKDLTEQVEIILETMQERMPHEYHDDIGRYLFEVSGIAERKGFELGMKYMAKLLMESLS